MNMNNQKRSELELIREEKLERLKELGIPVYPSLGIISTHTTKEVLSGEIKESNEVSLTGRIMERRMMGKSCFISIQDQYGRLQVYIRRDILCLSQDVLYYDELVKKLLDIGDIIGVDGEVFTTKTGERSLKVKKISLLSKSLRPLPDVKKVSEKGDKSNSEVVQVFNDFANPEQRYRQRYVDLIVHPEVRDIFIKRSKIIKFIRAYFDNKGYLEVETPILQPIYGGASARPFVTHHNSLKMPLYLRISNELYLKRLIVGGYSGVYEFAKDFRNEGMSRFHNPEFTQVEVYVAYRDYKWMMGQMEKILFSLVQELHGSQKIMVGDDEIDFSLPWKRYTLYGAIEHFTGIDVSKMDQDSLIKELKKLKISIPECADRAKLIDTIFGDCVEPNLINPTFITDHPVDMSPLAKRKAEEPELTERFEVICNRKELCNAFSELNDPIDQRKRFEEQGLLAKKGDQEAMPLDEDFLRALEYGMPPTVGLGIGIDRLTMLLTNSPSIQEVIFFPQMKLEK